MRCESCNKFVGQEQAEPEVNSVDVDETTVRAEVRISLQCTECGGDLKEATLDMDAEFELPEGWHEEEVECDACNGAGEVAPGQEGAPYEPCKKCGGLGMLASNDLSAFEAEEQNSEATVRTEGRGLGTKTWYGASVEVEVTHPDFPDWSATVTLTGEERASSMDEC
jgi:hypothetical protein